MEIRSLEVKHHSRTHNVAMVGAFPPPVHGAALVNLAVRDAIVNQECICAKVFNLSPSNLKRSLGTRLIRLQAVLKSALGFVSQCIKDRSISLYLGASGGFGQLYEAAFVICARFFSIPVVIHHHSFSYIDRPKWHARFLTWVAGSEALHVVLCPDMAYGLNQKYRSVKKVLTLSNAIFIPTPSVGPREEGGPRTIGFLGNISEEKGIYEVIELAKRLADDAVQFVISGPFRDANVETEVLLRIKPLKSVRYVGPKYEREKEEFFRQIDILVFPSRYTHEAEPLTVLEALANGVPVIATERGCIKRLVPDAVGKVVGRQDDFASVALEQINKWRGAPGEFSKSARAAQNHFSYLKDGAAQSLQDLLHALGCNGTNSRGAESGGKA